MGCRQSSGRDRTDSEKTRGATGRHRSSSGRDEAAGKSGTGSQFSRAASEDSTFDSVSPSVGGTPNASPRGATKSLSERFRGLLGGSPGTASERKSGKKRQRLEGGRHQEGGPNLGSTSDQESARSLHGRPRFQTRKSSFRLRSQSSNYDKVHELVKNQKLAADPHAGLVGLENLGNTCFMNTALQCLSNCEALTDYFLGFDWKKEINPSNPLGHGGRMARGYGRLTKLLWSTAAHQVAPESFKASVDSIMPQFQGYQQHDVQEFLAFLLDAIHEDLNRVTVRPPPPAKDTSEPEVDPEDPASSPLRQRGDPPRDSAQSDEVRAMDAWKGYLLRNKSIIVDLFQGQLRSSLKCNVCGFKSVKFDPFMYLTVPAAKQSEHPTIQQCIELFCVEEQLDGDNLWRCPKCKDFRAATKKLDLWKLPPVFIIHIKRFDHDRNGRRSKLNSLISFPLQHLDLSEFVKSPQREPPDYDLFAAANHHGSLLGGHYTAYAKSRVNQQWFAFNDNDVKPLAPEKVQTGAAYVLFYTKMAVTDSPRAAADGKPQPGRRRTNQLVRRQSATKPHLWPHMVPLNLSAAQERSAAAMGSTRRTPRTATLPEVPEASTEVSGNGSARVTPEGPVTASS